MKTFLISLLLAFPIWNCFAQTTLKGALKDQSGKALAFVSVGLLKSDVLPFQTQ